MYHFYIERQKKFKRLKYQSCFHLGNLNLEVIDVKLKVSDSLISEMLQDAREKTLQWAEDFIKEYLQFAIEALKCCSAGENEEIDWLTTFAVGLIERRR